MTREEAIERVGVELVEDVEATACDFTNRITDGTEWDGYVEFSASSRRNDEGDFVVAYYYQKEQDVDSVEDLGSLDWEIDHYEIMY